MDVLKAPPKIGTFPPTPETTPPSPLVKPPTRLPAAIQLDELFGVSSKEKEEKDGKAYQYPPRPQQCPLLAQVRLLLASEELACRSCSLRLDFVQQSSGRARRLQSPKPLWHLPLRHSRPQLLLERRHPLRSESQLSSMCFSASRDVNIPAPVNPPATPPCFPVRQGRGGEEE